MIKNRNGILLLLIIVSGISIIACSNNDGTEKPAKTAEVVQIAETDLTPFVTFEEDTIAIPTDLIFLPDGSIAILDREYKTVFLFTKKGKLLKSFGGEGKGPGEFVYPVSLQLASNTIWVLDIRQRMLHQFTVEGNFITSNILEERAIIGMRDIKVLTNHELLLPAGGKQNSLVFYRDTKSADDFYFGAAMGDSTRGIRLGKAKKQIANGEIPAFLKNQILIGASKKSYYFFLKAYGIVQKYDHSGNLIWKKELNLPSMTNVYKEWQENNKKAQAFQIYSLVYARDMVATENFLYILMNTVEGENQLLLRLNNKGQIVKKFEFVSNTFNSISITPEGNTVYLIDGALGRVMKMQM